MTIYKPNYTQIPNSILGDVKRGNVVDPGLMATLEGAELKVLLAVCRLTFGYHQETRRASLSMIKNMTGLSRQGVINASNSLEKKNLIARRKDGGVTLWQVVVNSVDYLLCEPMVNSVDSVVNSVDQTSQMIRLPSKKETKKETIKETIESAAIEKTSASKSTPLPPVIPSVKIFVETTGKYALNKTQIKAIESEVGNTPASLEKWQSVVTAWQLAGYKLTNVTGMIDWFKNGIPVYKNGKGANGNGTYKRNNATDDRGTGKELARRSVFDPNDPNDPGAVGARELPTL